MTTKQEVIKKLKADGWKTTKQEVIKKLKADGWKKDTNSRFKDAFRKGDTVVVVTCDWETKAWYPRELTF